MSYWKVLHSWSHSRSPMRFGNILCGCWNHKATCLYTGVLLPQCLSTAFVSFGQLLSSWVHSAHVVLHQRAQLQYSGCQCTIAMSNWLPVPVQWHFCVVQ